MTELTYEHPLNEKLRTYLRLEYLLTQLHNLNDLDSEWQQQAFFNALFDLIEVLDRNDIRPDLIKDCERSETALVKWASHPSVADDKLQALLQQAVRLQSELLRSEPVMGLAYDESPLFSEMESSHKGYRKSLLFSMRAPWLFMVFWLLLGAYASGSPIVSACDNEARAGEQGSG